jgi:hypothetical protein
MVYTIQKYPEIGFETTIIILELPKTGMRLNSVELDSIK